MAAAPSVRNPRRRQRPDSDTPPGPRRKRSKVIADSTRELVVRQSATPSDTPVATAPANAAVNGTAAAAAKKSSRNDAATSVLTRTDYYTVRNLPSTPNVPRNNDSRVSLVNSASASLALAVTNGRVYIWDYASPTPVTHPRVFDVPEHAKSASSLAHAALVTSGPSKALGLIVVSSTSGAITYWDNIDTAESLGMFLPQKSEGVQGLIGNFAGETVIDLNNAEHAGFVATLSSGRIAHITLTDSQGKAKVGVQFLRSYEAASTKGLFGSVRNALGVGAWKRDVVALRTKQLGALREVQAVAATESGQLQVWHLAWTGHHTFKASYELGEILLQGVAAQSSTRSTVSAGRLRTLDFAIQQGLQPLVRNGQETQPLDILLLAQVESGTAIHYYLFDVSLNGDRAHLERVIPIRSATNNSAGGVKPTLRLPKPGHTAFVIFGQKIVVASVTCPTSGPEAQLLSEGAHAPDTYQDTLTLRADKGLTFSSSCDEMASGHTSSIALYVKGHGLVRVATNNGGTAIDDEEGGRTGPSIRERLEQAVFFGDAMFDLSKQPTDVFEQEQVEAAAVNVSESILRSSTSLVPALSVMQTHLAFRTTAARVLATYLKQNYSPISPATSGRLMADAEKLAAAEAVWNNYDSTALLPVAIKYYYLSNGADRKNKEADQLRNWFLHDVDAMGSLRNSVLAFITNKTDPGPPAKFMQHIHEANDSIITMYDAVYAFRTNNAELYSSSADPWTSTDDFIKTLNSFIDISRDFPLTEYEKEHADFELVERIAEQTVRAVQILCKCYEERYSSNYSAGPFAKSRRHHLLGLSRIGKASASIAIAEKYRDMDTLVKLVIEQMTYLVSMTKDPTVTDPVERRLIHSQMTALQDRVDGYFQTFGDDWANVFFAAHLEKTHSHGLLNQAVIYQKPLARYLRADRARARLAWINDVLHTGDLEEASQALTKLARHAETRSWNKKVQFSLGKLAALALEEKKGARPEKLLKVQENGLTLTNIQDAIRSHFDHVLYAAVDTHAEVQLASDAYTLGVRSSLPALGNVVVIAVEDLINNKSLGLDDLIDLLTLMDSKSSDKAEADIAGTEFYLALKALNAAAVVDDIDEQRFEMLHKLIWKRCWVHPQEHWDLINETGEKSDQEVARELRETTVCKTMALCTKNGLFSNESKIRPLPPSETLGAGCSVQDVEYRFKAEDLQVPVLGDNAKQDEQLRRMVNEYRVDHWSKVCEDEVKNILREKAEANETWERDLADNEATIEETWEG